VQLRRFVIVLKLTLASLARSAVATANIKRLLVIEDKLMLGELFFLRRLRSSSHFVMFFFLYDAFASDEPLSEGFLL